VPEDLEVLAGDLLGGCGARGHRLGAAWVLVEVQPPATSKRCSRRRRPERAAAAAGRGAAAGDFQGLQQLLGEVQPPTTSRILKILLPSFVWKI
jgi:hypothetical protein